MSNGPAYLMVGRGRWAMRMRKILAGENRSIVEIEQTRQKNEEQEADYRMRLEAWMRRSKAQVAWLCVPPGSHVGLMAKAAIGAGLHVVVEKPWFGSRAETVELQELADHAGKRIGVHYEYCLLEEVEAWSARFSTEAGLSFSGKFHHRQSDHLHLDALDNFGTHLVSIRNFAVPGATMGALDCAYDRPDQRTVCLERRGSCIASLDLLTCHEPIVQRFIAKFEAAMEGQTFFLDLTFAMHVAEEISAFRRLSAVSGRG